MTTDSNPTSELAQFVADTALDDIPTQVRQRAIIVLVDTVASAAAGVDSDEAGMIENVARLGGGVGSSPVVGRASMSPVGAVLVNGYLVTATTVCDVYRPALCHVTPEVFPPALAVGVERRVSGGDFLLAFALGLEVTTRILAGTNYPAFRANGWHSPGVFGPFGGAAAAGKLLKLDPNVQNNAFGLAGSQAAGTFAHWGTPTIKFHQSRGAFSGYLAAVLASSGFKAGQDVLTAPDGGIYSTYSDGGQPEIVTSELGARWELERLSLRPWPLASSLQSVATALLHLVETHRVGPGDIRHVSVSLSSVVYQMHGEITWEDRFHALLSARYVTAVILADAQCWLEQFTPERIADPALGKFAREQVSVVLDESIEGTGAQVELELGDGQRLVDRRTVPHGDEQDPLSLDDVGEKFLLSVARILGDKDAQAALDRLCSIEGVTEVDPALFACQPAGRSR